MRRSLRLPVVVALLTAGLLLPAIAIVAAVEPSLASAATSVLDSGLPSHTLTPGVTNPGVTQATIHSTICVSGWTSTIRPPTSYTTALKKTQLIAYGFADRSIAHYEEDHLISLELGGSPRSAQNLWPEPHHITLANGPDVGSYTKDAFENHVRREVCAGRLTLAKAQYEIARNWVAYWKVWKAGATGAPASPTPSSAATTAPTPMVTATPDPVAAAKAAGATAVCNDGTWSYSASRSGTCSRHGGVYWWTGIVGPAGPG